MKNTLFIILALAGCAAAFYFYNKGKTPQSIAQGRPTDLPPTPKPPAEPTTITNTTTVIKYLPLPAKKRPLFSDLNNNQSQA